MMACSSKESGKEGGSEGDPPKASGQSNETEEPSKAAKPVLACDQRDFISKMEQDMAKELKREPKPKGVCIDYSKRSKELGPASCMQGKPLETPCPDDGVVATCTMEKSGAVFKHYQGSDLSTGKRLCKTMEGVYAEN